MGVVLPVRLLHYDIKNIQSSVPLTSDQWVKILLIVYSIRLLLLYDVDTEGIKWKALKEPLNYTYQILTVAAAAFSSSQLRHVLGQRRNSALDLHQAMYREVT